MAPYTPLVSVHASAGTPRATAAATSASGLETPVPMENHECTCRWANIGTAGFGVRFHRGDAEARRAAEELLVDGGPTDR